MDVEVKSQMRENAGEADPRRSLGVVESCDSVELGVWGCECSVGDRWQWRWRF